MSDFQVDDRIDALAAKLEKIRKGTDAVEFAYQSAQTLGQRMLRNLMTNAPRGTVEPDYIGVTGIEAFEIGSRRQVRVISHGRPSLRLHGITLQQGWGQPEVERSSHGASFEISSSAPQMTFLLAGSEAHPISGNPWLSFWHHKAGGPVLTKAVNHPGHPPSDMVEQAEQQMSGDYGQTLDQMIDRVLRPLRE